MLKALIMVASVFNSPGITGVLKVETPPGIKWTTTFQNNGAAPALVIKQDGTAICSGPPMSKAKARRVIGDQYMGIYLAICNPPHKRKDGR